MARILDEDNDDILRVVQFCTSSGIFEAGDTCWEEPECGVFQKRNDKNTCNPSWEDDVYCCAKSKVTPFLLASLLLVSLMIPLVSSTQEDCCVDSVATLSIAAIAIALVVIAAALCCCMRRRREVVYSSAPYGNPGNAMHQQQQFYAPPQQGYYAPPQATAGLV